VKEIHIKSSKALLVLGEYKANGQQILILRSENMTFLIPKDAFLIQEGKEN